MTRMTDYYEELVSLIEDFFGDEDKVKLWFNTENPMYGGMTPNKFYSINPMKTYYIAWNSYAQGLVDAPIYNTNTGAVLNGDFRED